MTRGGGHGRADRAQENRPGEEPGDERPRSDLARRLGAARQRHRRRGRLYRAGVVAAGILITVAGVIMTALPGPAILVIPIGLYLIALEFDRAERALVWALDYAERQRRRAAGATTRQKVLSGVGAAVVLAGAFTAALLLFDLPLLPDD